VIARTVLALMLAALPLVATAGAAGNRYFDVVDTDHDGRVSLDEYLERMTWAFRRMDANQDGVLETAEQLAPNAPRTTLAELRARLQAQFRRQDRNHDGGLDPAEFLAPPA
jgi:Ca2+-binding EF-hand superfamily protein